MGLWSEPLGWREISAPGKVITLRPDVALLSEIANLLGIEVLESIEARIIVTPWLDGIEITGDVRAVATRQCGVSLELFDEMIDESMRVRIVPRGSANAPEVQSREVDIDLEAEDPPDVVDGDTIDLASYVIEFLSLALNPFPRKPDAVFEAPLVTGKFSPFSVLARFRSSTEDD